MFKNFIKVTFRNIAAHKVYSIINILGLAIGIACTLIVALYINHEFSFDRFHRNYDEIYRVTLKGRLGGVDFNGAPTTPQIANAIDKDSSPIYDVTRLTRLGAWLIANDSIRYNEDNLLFVDYNFLDFFSGFEVLQGDVATMLAEPRSIVLTTSSAQKYFGTTDSVVGKKLKVESREKMYTVTGIISDVPSNSHIHFDMLASIVTFDKILNTSWASNNVYTYIKIADRGKVDEASEYINGFFESHVLPELNNNNTIEFSDDDSYTFALQPVSSIHLYSALEAELEPNGKAIYVYSLGIIALLLVVIACLNFMNLSTANSSNRSFEVSLRKVVGADKRFLVLQFLIESVIISLVALVLALVLAEVLLPYFNKFLELNLELSLFANIKSFLIVLLLTILVGVLAGSYPAIFVANFNPVVVLGDKFIRGVKNSKVRAVFVVLQFFISISIITVTIVIFAQVNFMLNKELGFDKDNILVIRRSDALDHQLADFKADILKYPGVKAATNSNSIPGRDFYISTFRLKGEKEDIPVLFNQVYVNYEFLETFNLKIKQGRFFSPDIKTDSFACVLNQAAVDQMNLSYPVGSLLVSTSTHKKDVNFEVVGVVEDFHYKSLDEKIAPLVICLMPGNWEGYINVRITGADKMQTISRIEKVWYNYAPDYPFVYFFLNDDFNKSYSSLIKLGRLFIVFSILAVLVACLGLYGLLAYAANQRTREIGIRKALGASIWELVLVLSKEVILLLFYSTIISWVVSFLLIRFWLNDFYYSISVNPLYFLVSLLVVLMVVLPTVILHSLKIARKNPGTSIRIV